MRSYPIAFLIIFGFLLENSSCSKPAPTENSNNSIINQVEAVDTGSVDPRADLEKVFQAIVDASSYRVVTSVESDNGQVQHREWEYRAPDRSHLILESNKLSDVRRETISIGTETFVKIGAEPWKKSPLSILDKLVQFHPKEIADNIKKSSEIKYIGSEKIDGTQMRIFQYLTKSSLHPESELIEKVWIGASDGLIYQMESGVESIIDGQAVKTKKIAKISAYNSEINIEKPM